MAIRVYLANAVRVLAASPLSLVSVDGAGKLPRRTFIQPLLACENLELLHGCL